MHKGNKVGHIRNIVGKETPCQDLHAPKVQPSVTPEGDKDTNGNLNANVASDAAASHHEQKDWAREARLSRDRHHSHHDVGLLARLITIAGRWTE